MLKRTITTLALSAIVASSVYATTQLPSAVIDVNKVQQNTQDIQLLKLAVVKLIKRVDLLDEKAKVSEQDKQNIAQQINAIASSVNTVQEQQKRFVEVASNKVQNVVNKAVEPKPQKEEIQDKRLNDQMDKVLGQPINDKKLISYRKNYKISDPGTAPQGEVVDPNRVYSSSDNKRHYNDEQLVQTYIPFRRVLEITVTKRPKIYVYDKPVLLSWGSKRVGTYFYGAKLYADMYTTSGWIHIINKGWVKGYLVSPHVDKIRKIQSLNK